MAGFEFARVGGAGEMAREWHIGRYVPLYLAGLAAGAAVGLGLSVYGSQQDIGEQAAIAAPVVTTVSEAPYIPATPSLAADPTGAAPAIVFAAAPLAEPVAPAIPVAESAKPQAVTPAVPVAAAPVAAPSAPVVPADPPVAANPPVAAAAAPAKPNFYVPAVSGGGATVLEHQLFDGINDERAKAGLAPYVLDAGLTKIARTRSQQMADQGYFAHTDPNGTTMYTALLSYFGYTSYAWAGENLAMNNYSSTEAAQRAVVSLMNSPTHRANLLADDFFRIGIGEVTTADGRHIFSMIFLG